MQWTTSCVLFVQLWFCVSVSKIYEEKYEGDDCELEDNVQGKCVRLAECPSAIDIIQKREHPVTCGYIGFTPIVCCPVAHILIKPTHNFQTTQENIDISTTEASSDVINSSSVTLLTEIRTSDFSEQECSNLQHVVLKPRENLIYLHDKQQKLKNINNEIADFPHRVVLGVSLASDGKEFGLGGIRWGCGGSLISEKFILTAAHCLFLKNLDWANIGNALLHTYTQLSDPKQVLYKIIRRIQHPLYKTPSVYHNIALIEIDRPVVFTKYTRPACLYVGQAIDPKIQLKAAGWGLKNVDESEENLVKLENVNLELFTENECDTTYKDISGSTRLSTGIVHKEQFCAGRRSDTTNTCKIFSGGDLQFNINSTTGVTSYIVGINSFGDTCGLKGAPSVYTRVAAYIPWIESVVWPQSESQASPAEPILNALTEILTPEREPTKLSDEKCSYFLTGSVPVSEEEFPHRVTLRFLRTEKSYNITWACAGTLISEKFILTAAHCLVSEHLKYLTWTFVVNAHYEIIRRIPHPLYKPPSTHHDIALVELDRPVEFKKNLKPACLHQNHDIDPKTQFLAIGTLKRAHQRKVNLDLFTTDECERIFENLNGTRPLRMHSNQFCAGGRRGIQDTCLIDSGGALQFKLPGYTGNIWHIYGITSFGENCGKQGVPRIHTRVEPYVPWIESVVWANEDSQISPTLSTRLTTYLSDRKCLYYREAEIKIKLYRNNWGASPSGGVFAEKDEFPHMVGLGFTTSKKEYDISWQCGGSLISDKFVLTAAHCLYSEVLGNLTWALLGTERNDVLLHPEQHIYKIIRRIKHPLYKLPAKYHDIALVELNKPVEISKHIKPACLRTKHDDYYTSYIATGWGLTENGIASSELIKVDVVRFTGNECDEAYENFNGSRRLRNGIKHENQLCAGSRTGIQDTCPGDSGGPLQNKITLQGYPYGWTILGITSFGITCGLQGVPGVYTRVQPYVPWIQSIVWPNEYIPDYDEPDIIVASKYYYYYATDEEEATRRG